MQLFAFFRTGNRIKKALKEFSFRALCAKKSLAYFILKVTFLTRLLAASESLFTEVSSPAPTIVNLDASTLALTKVSFTLLALAFDNVLL